MMSRLINNQSYNKYHQPMKVTKNAKKGFSLVEMLVVIAIIGVIAAIAVPQISNFTEAANKGKDQRNAQNLSSVCSAAQAAGHDFVASLTTEAEIVDAVVLGATVASGAFKDEYFGVPNMSPEEKVNALVYLELKSGVLCYKPAGDTGG